jgi:hypothetical protein
MLPRAVNTDNCWAWWVTGDKWARKLTVPDLHWKAFPRQFERKMESQCGYVWLELQGLSRGEILPLIQTVSRQKGLISTHLSQWHPVPAKLSKSACSRRLKSSTLEKPQT